MVNADNTPQPTTQPVPQPESTPITPEAPVVAQTHPPEELEKQRQLHLIQFYLIKLLAILLALQGLWSLFNSIKFIFVELPALEQQLSRGLIESFEINAFANKAILMTFSTVMSLFFALRITITQSKVARQINTVIGILLLIGNTQINNFLTQIGSGQLITSAIIDALKSLFSI